MSWKRKLEQALRTSMKYCFACVDGKYQDLNEEEFTGTEGQGGFLHFVQSIFFDERKRCFERGYNQGVVDCFEDMKPYLKDKETLVVQPEASIGAFRRFEEFDRE